jgi:hydrogenase maturation protein HypF
MVNRFEGEAAMEWEWLADGVNDAERYPMPVQRCDKAPAILDWGPLVHALLADIRGGVTASIMSARFHNGLIEGILNVCRVFGERRVVLSGGCFLNRRLLEGVVERLTQEGFQPYWHQRVPTGDGMALIFFRSPEEPARCAETVLPQSLLIGR